MVTFQYAILYKLTPESPLELFDSILRDSDDQSFLYKHGNGHLIRSVDEALHTIKIGDKRRVFVQKSMGYVEVALGSVPI